MGFFFNHFEQEGPGIDKDLPPKQGFNLFIDVLIREFWNLCKLNLIFILFCLPIVTIFPACAAFTKVIILMIRDEPQDIFSEFKHTFLTECKRSYLMGLGLSLTFFLVLSALIFYYRYSPALFCLCFAFFFYLLMVASYLFPQAVCLQLDWKQLIRNCLVLPFLSPIRTFFSVTIFLFFFFIQLLLFPISIWFILAFGISLSVYPSLFLSWESIKRFVLKP